MGKHLKHLRFAVTQLDLVATKLLTSASENLKGVKNL